MLILFKILEEQMRSKVIVPACFPRKYENSTMVGISLLNIKLSILFAYPFTKLLMP